MEVLENFFSSLTLPKTITKKGDELWENPNADIRMNKYIHKKYAAIDEPIIQQMERSLQSRWNVKFPKWYHSFLQYANGISVFYGAIALHGYQIINRTNLDWESPCSLEIENLGRHKNVPKEWLFIGGYVYDGTEIVIDTKKESSEVFCLYNETDEIVCSWNSFEEFLCNELKRLQQLYLQKPWRMLDLGVDTLPDGHKKK